jgi:hypothetical protein
MSRRFLQRGVVHPPLSATSKLFKVGTSSVKVSLVSSLGTIFALFSGKPLWTGLAAFRPCFSDFSETISEGSKGVFSPIHGTMPLTNQG